MQPDVSVIVPVLDAARTLGDCLDALGAQVLDAAAEVIVVDNGSADASRVLAASHPAVDTVLDEPATGSYAARNAGLRAATGRVVAFTDADCVPDRDWAAAGLVAVSGAELVGGAILPRATPSPNAWERYDRALYLDQADYVGSGFAATANLFVRREVFDAIGGFDPSLRSSGDLEFGLRARAAGFVLHYSEAARVSHRPRTDAAGTWRLHRRLGAGWRHLADRDLRPTALRDPAMSVPLGRVVDLVAREGPPLRRRELVPVHATAMLARWVGWLTGRD